MIDEGVTIKIRRELTSDLDAGGTGFNRNQQRKLDDLQTSTTYGFKIANYIEDSVKTYDLGMKKKRNKPCSTFREFHRTTRVDNFIFEEHAFKTTKNFDNLFFLRKLN
jgi:hypothetical protein